MSRNSHERILSVVDLAVDVFEDREAAISWMSRPNAALGGHTPAYLCETELGERQVRQVLHALKWGGVV